MKVLRKETAIKIKDMMIRAAEREGHMEVQRVLRGAMDGDGNTERGASALYDLWEEIDDIRWGVEFDLLQLMTDITFDGPVYTRIEENTMESRFKVLTEGRIGDSIGAPMEETFAADAGAEASFFSRGYESENEDLPDFIYSAGNEKQKKEFLLKNADLLQKLNSIPKIDPQEDREGAMKAERMRKKLSAEIEKKWNAHAWSNGSSMEEGYNDSNMQSHNGRTDNAPHHRKENLFQAYARAAMAAAFPDGGRIDPEIKKRAVRRIRQAYRSLKEKGTVNDRMGGEAYAALGTKIGKLISRHLVPEEPEYRYGD